MVTFPYNTADFAFTLNDVFINFSTQETDTYFDLEVTIKYFDFFSTLQKTAVLEYKIPLFNQQQVFNVGRKIHRFLSTPPLYANTHGFQYRTAKVSFEVKELRDDISKTAIISTETLNNVKFIAGEQPKLIENNNALLSSNIHLERVTKNGFFIVNFLLSETTHLIKIYKNEIEVFSEVIQENPVDNIYAVKLNISDFNGSKGDVFKIVLDETNISKSIVVFPDNLESKQLIFQDNFNLFRSLECTGHFSFPKKYDQITHKYKRNLVEVLEIVATEKINSFKINTGWLLKTSTVTIDALLECKKVYYVENDATILEMVPIAKNITGENSEEELYAYDLEFQINKTHA